MIGVVLVGMRDDWLGWKVGMDGIVEMVGWTVDGWVDGQWMKSEAQMKPVSTFCFIRKYLKKYWKVLETTGKYWRVLESTRKALQK